MKNEFAVWLLKTNLIALLALLCFTASAAASAQDAPRVIVFGAEAAESAGKLAAQQSTTGADANGLTYRRLNKGGKLTFELACDPALQNYLTIRVNGSEKNSGYLFLVQPDGAKDALNPVGPASEWGELDGSSDNAPFAGRYYYDTYIIPLPLTQKRNVVRLTIESRGVFGFYGDNRHHEQTEPSKGVYLAAVHTDTFYTEPGEEKLGQVPPPGHPIAARNGLASYDYLKMQSRNALDTLLRWQIYGDNFTQARASHANFSPMLEGAIVTGQDMTNSATDGRWKDRGDWTEDQWLKSFTGAAINNQNWCPMMGVEALANAYAYEWSGRYFHNRETLDRMFKALDFWCLAQDRVGAFAVIEDNGHPRQWAWIGAKTDRSGSREEGYNWDLQANGVPSLAKGFITVYNDVTGRKSPSERRWLTEYLDEAVDSDYTGKKEKTRRQALAQLYAQSRSFFANKGGDYFDPSKRSNTPSQGFNIECLYSLNRALQLLADSLKFSAKDRAIRSEYLPWPTSRRTDRLPQMLFDRMGEMADGEKWFSETGGLSLEGGASSGGYCGNYGIGMQGGLDNLARLTEGDTLIHAKVAEKLNAAINAYQYFYRRDSENGNSALAIETIIGARNIYNNVRPSYGIHPYAILKLDNAAALRKAQLYGEDGRAYLETAGNGFFYYHLLELQSLSNYYALIEKKIAAKSADKKPCYLPMEAQAPDSVFADMDAQTMAVKSGGERFWVMFNWKRHRWQVTDITRIHYLAPMVGRIANVKGSHQGEVELISAASRNAAGLAPDGKYYDHRAFEILNQVRYGKYLIAQNVSKTKTFSMDAPGVKKAVNLATKEVYTRFPIAVKPRTALVLQIVE